MIDVRAEPTRVRVCLQPAMTGTHGVGVLDAVQGRTSIVGPLPTTHPIDARVEVADVEVYPCRIRMF